MNIYVSHFRRNRDIEKILSTYGSYACYGSLATIIISTTFLGTRSSSRQSLRNATRVITANGMLIMFLFVLIFFFSFDNSRTESSLQIPVSFGVLSKSGYMSLLLPTWQNDLTVDTIYPPSDLQLEKSLPPELVRQENLTRLFTHRLHWELSTTLTSNHLLAMVAMSNTLMSMTMATFIPEHERAKKLQRQSTRVNASWTNEEHEELYTQQQAQIKQGWSLLSTHHCFLLPDKIDALGKSQRKYFFFLVNNVMKLIKFFCRAPKF